MAEKNRRGKFWNKVKGAGTAVKSDKWLSAWRTGVAIGAVIFTFWTSSIRNQSEQVKRELAEYKQSAAFERAELKGQIFTVNTRVEGCEKRIHRYEEEREAAYEEAQKLPPSKTRRNILRLTKPISQAVPNRAENVPFKEGN